MHKSKNRYFYHIFVSPGDAPEAITLNVVWMERDFDAYKLSRWMCPTNYNRFSDRAGYWSKIVIFSYPLHSTPPLRGFLSEHRHPVWHAKTRIKQQKYFHHFKRPGYNTEFLLYPRPFRWWKYCCCFICITLLWALHIVVKQQFFYIYICLFAVFLLTLLYMYSFYRAMLCISAVFAVTRCLSVRHVRELRQND